MPFLFRRIRENIFLFIAMGLLYFFIYRNVQMPDNAIALPISYGGFLIFAMFIHEYFLYSYLLNIGNPNVYLLTNLVAYAVYVVFFYIIYFLGTYLVPAIGTFYNIIFKFYDLFVFTGISRGFSSFLVHIVYIISIIITPFFIKDNTVNPLDNYLKSEEE